MSVEKIYVKYDREAFVQKLLAKDYPERKQIAEKFFGIKIEDTL